MDKLLLPITIAFALLPLFNAAKVGNACQSDADCGPQKSCGLTDGNDLSCQCSEDNVASEDLNTCHLPIGHYCEENGECVTGLCDPQIQECDEKFKTTKKSGGPRIISLRASLKISVALSMLIFAGVS